MISSSPVSLAQFEASLSGIAIKRLKMIYISQLMGTLLFALVVLWVTTRQPAVPQGAASAEQVVRRLSLSNAGVALFLFWAGTASFNAILKGKRVRGPEATAESVIGAITNAEIVRLTLFEAAAFFGIAVVLVAHLSGELARSPVYWTNLATAGLIFGVGLGSFPSRERLLNLFRTRIAPN